MGGVFGENWAYLDNDSFRGQHDCLLREVFSEFFSSEWSGIGSSFVLD